MYPSANQRNSGANYAYPGLTDNYQSNNGYVPTAPTAYSNPNQPRNNPDQPNTVNNQATNAAMGFSNQSAAFRHGASQNPNFQEDNLMNKDLDNTLEGGARAGFIRKVYTLLTLQLLVTVGIGFWAYNSPLFKTVFMNTPMIIILSVLLMGLSCFISCATEAFRKFALPIFIAFTLVFALLVGVSICGYKSKIILMAAGLTLLLTAGLTIFACVTKSDLTSWGPYLFIFCLILFVFGIVCIFWKDPIVHLIYSCLSALLFGVYLIFDTQMVLGKGQYSYTLDDAYMASIQLYIDIIQLFLHLLKILSYIDR